MADPVTLGLVLGAASGVAKSELVDRPKEQRQRKLRATEERLSGWTKRAPSTQIQEADPLGSALSYGVQGGSFGGGMQSNQAQNELLKKMASGGAGASSGSGWDALQTVQPQSKGALGGNYGDNFWDQNSLFGGGF